MALDPDKIRLLLKMLQNTQDLELTCPECIAELDKYAQSTLDKKPLDAILERVRQHLGACNACDDEFNLILETLRAIEEP
jgi:hypothetical protein